MFQNRSDIHIKNIKVFCYKHRKNIYEKYFKMKFIF